MAAAASLSNSTQTVRDRPCVNMELTGTHEPTTELAHPRATMYPKPRVHKLATTHWPYHVRSSSGLIAIVVMTLFVSCNLFLRIFMYGSPERLQRLLRTRHKDELRSISPFQTLVGFPYPGTIAQKSKRHPVAWFHNVLLLKVLWFPNYAFEWYQ